MFNILFFTFRTNYVGVCFSPLLHGVTGVAHAIDVLKDAILVIPPSVPITCMFLNAIQPNY